MGLATLDFPGFFPLRISHSQCWSGPFLKWINNYSPHIHHITTWFFHHITTIIHHNYSHIHHIFTTYSPDIHQIFTRYSPDIHQIFTTYSPHIHHFSPFFTRYSPFFTTMIFNGSIPGFRGSSLVGSCRHEPHEALSDGEAEQRLDRRAHLCGCRTGVAPLAWRNVDMGWATPSWMVVPQWLDGFYKVSIWLLLFFFFFNGLYGFYMFLYVFISWKIRKENLDEN